MFQRANNDRINFRIYHSNHRREFIYHNDCVAGDIISYQTTVESITEKEGKLAKEKDDAKAKIFNAEKEINAGRKAAVVEAGEKRSKAAAKQMKHTAKGSEKAPIVQRKALSR